MKPHIRVRNLTKSFNLYASPKKRLQEAIDPFRRQFHEKFDAISDVSFDIEAGTSIGIIGRNGAGKSTLLKLLTGIYAPTSGSLEVQGRVAALIELGAGFNPDISGRDNIFFQGAILGFSRREMENKVDEIITFAGIGEFIDQPVRTYSSGMFARLAFSIAINVDPDILIVDEALAVGDMFFQAKCYAKIRNFLDGRRIVLFVAHDYEAIRTLTQRAILMENGKVVLDGPSKEVTLRYRAAGSETILPRQAENSATEFGDRDCEIISVESNDKESGLKTYYPGDIVHIRVQLVAHKKAKNLNVGLRIRNREGVKVYSGGTLNSDLVNAGQSFLESELSPGDTVSFDFEFKCTLGASLYEVQAYVVEEREPHYLAQRMLHWRDDAFFFEVKHRRDDVFFGGIADVGLSYSFELKKT